MSDNSDPTGFLIAAGVAVWGICLFLTVLFLTSLSECLKKIEPQNRVIEPRSVWWNLIPVFGSIHLFFTVVGVSRSLKQEVEARGQESTSSYGLIAGITFLIFNLVTVAVWFVIYLISGLILSLVASRGMTEILAIGSATLLTLGLYFTLWGWYWTSIVRYSKQLERNGFWVWYSSSAEFPSSLLASLMCHSMAIAAVILIVVIALGAKDTEAVPIRLVEGGWDETGAGSAGSGGEVDPLAKGDSTPTKQDRDLLPTTLPEIQDVKNKILDLDPSTTGSIPDEKVAAFAALDAALRDKLLGERRGSGPGAGTGNTGEAGGGPGGPGADSTRARSLRWILRFRTRDGRDYLNQLKAMGATVTVPIPPENKQMYLFRDLENPKPGTIATDSDLAVLSKQIQFSDFRRESVEGIGKALGLNYTPTVFWAFFPPGLEKELARLEVAYRNRRPEDIEETIYMVTVRNGEPALVVVEQRAKR